MLINFWVKGLSQVSIVGSTNWGCCNNCITSYSNCRSWISHIRVFSQNFGKWFSLIFGIVLVILPTTKISIFFYKLVKKIKKNIMCVSIFILYNSFYVTESNAKKLFPLASTSFWFKSLWSLWTMKWTQPSFLHFLRATAPCIWRGGPSCLLAEYLWTLLSSQMHC